MVLAREEWHAAETLLKDSAPRQAIYFQQQAVEKLLRAVLEVEDMFAGPTHNIRALADMLPKGHQLHASFLAFDELTSAATRYRYPGGAGQLFTADDRKVAEFLPAIDGLIEEVSEFLRSKGHESGAKS
jgi:HEPN domain-containing protein